MPEASNQSAHTEMHEAIDTMRRTSGNHADKYCLWRTVLGHSYLILMHPCPNNSWTWVASDIEEAVRFHWRTKIIEHPGKHLNISPPARTR